MREELVSVFTSQITKDKLPVVVMANKQDAERSATASDIADTLKLYEFPITWTIQLCSAKSGDGLLEGMKKMFEMVRFNKHPKSKPVI